MTDPKRILYVEQNTDGTVGGSHFSLLFLIEGLNKRIYSPIVVFYQENRLMPLFRKAGSQVMLLKKPRPLNLTDSFGNIRRLSNHKVMHSVCIMPLLILQKISNYFITFIIPAFACWHMIRKEKVNLVHLNNTLLRPQQWILASLFTRAKIMAHERGINNWFPFQSRFWARFLTALICISDAVKNNLTKHGFPEEQLYRIYNGLDPDQFTVTLSKKEILRDLGVDGKTLLIGIVGNIKIWKGQEIVIRSMKHVKKSFPRAKCLIIGGVSGSDKEYLFRLQEIVEKEGLRDSIIFTGSRNDVPDLINTLDILVHASVEPEPFGRVLLEGMALEKPVIATNIGAAPEIVEHGKTGLLVNPGDEKSLANAITSLLKEPQKAMEMGKAGRIRLDNYFHISHNIKNTEELYSKILQ